MEIKEAIARTLSVARYKRRCAETLRAHPFISRAHAGRMEEIEAEALEAVCNEVESLRAENERLRGELEEQRTRRIRQVFEHR